MTRSIGIVGTHHRTQAKMIPNDSKMIPYFCTEFENLFTIYVPVEDNVIIDLSDCVGQKHENHLDWPMLF